MKIFTSVKSWQMFRQTELINKQIGFVPTMGNLHEGHASLLQRSTQENDVTVLSIFVNPTQFNDSNDLTNYPRTLDEDIALADKCQVDYVLCPQNEELYSDEYRYRVNETEQSLIMEGEMRPGHFEGMLTVVLKLLLLIKPQKIYMGEKDFQQLQLVRGMVESFFLEVEVVGCPIVRDKNGLALSSRNSRLTPEEYLFAVRFPELLQQKKSLEETDAALKTAGFTVEYICDFIDRRCAAVRVGKVRLLDNIAL